MLLAVLSGGVSDAASPDRCLADRICRERTEAAAKLAAQTRYDEALALYQSAYERNREPRLLVNIGRCHYRLGRARRALEAYSAFLDAEPVPEPELAARVKQFVAEARQSVTADGGEPGKGRLDAQLQQAENPGAAASAPKPERGPRPAWRIGLGAGAMGLGVLAIGLGAGALAADGRCVMPSSAGMDLCQPTMRSEGMATTQLLDGKSTGAALLTAGSLLTVTGIVLIAVPGRRVNAVSGPSKVAGTTVYAAQMR